MASSPLVQATEEAIESLHRAAALWGRDVRRRADAAQSAWNASGIDCSCFFGVQRRLRRAPSLSHGAGTASLRRSPARAGAFSAGVTCSGTVRRAEEVGNAASQAARQAEAAFSAVSGKPLEQKETSRPVQGAILKLLSDRGYGFVRQTGATAEIFFTTQNVRGARFSELKVGQNVSFRIVPDPRVPGRMQAVEVQPLR